MLQVVISFGVDHITLPEIIDNFPKWATYILPIYRLGDFVIGCCLGYLYVNRREMKKFTRTFHLFIVRIIL